ncbi:response regulator transcription factor [Fusobacterium sp.]|uniref:response regulator transcription factor n=1 Tax=Fusobacterium sp. TaxID=68766 RepID=UPI00261FD634|nr:response regulator transcription factor [Fusobacterium sp.]
MKNILIIEDDEKIRRILQLELTHEGYRVDTAIDGDDGIDKFNSNKYDLILLDLMLPKLSGEEVCKNIRSMSEIPIIVITAKDQIKNKIELLDMGADDYITKPFNIDELFARMRVAFRNKSNYKSKDFLIYKNLKLDLQQKKFYIDNQEISITKREFALLEYFLINRELVLSREKILENIWGFDYEGDDKIVDVYINALRKKMKKNYIETVRGFGYILKSEIGGI